MKTAHVHSVETMGLVDGPGIRTVFFLQGCPLKCLYCHNPDTQHFMGQNVMTVDDVVEIAMKYRSYHHATGGGVTFSGGEPLMQGAFLVEALEMLKEKGVNTCIDTSGFGSAKHFDSILKHTDVVLLDIKQFDDASHAYWTGRTREGMLPFLKALERFNGSIIIRHVMIPGVTDNQRSMDALLKVIEPLEKNVDKIEILPYHKLGNEKYSQLNIVDVMADIQPMNSDVALTWESYVNEQLKGKRVILSSGDIAIGKIV